MKYAPVSAGKRFREFLFDAFILFLLSIGIHQGWPLHGFLWKILDTVIYVLYYVSFEFFMGQTPGKVNTKTKVVMADGSRVTLPAIVLRTIIRLIPFEALSFLTSKNPVGWHDKWSNTMVINSD